MVTPKRTSQTTRNPASSTIAEDIPLAIATHHIQRAKQRLAYQQAAGRFSKDNYDTFVGAGINLTSSGADRVNRVPPRMKRRDIEKISPYYLQFPGSIAFTAAVGADLREAVVYFLTRFNRTAPRSGQQKNHQFWYASSLKIFVDDVEKDAQGTFAALENADVGTKVELINVAPHASTLELFAYKGFAGGGQGVMYSAARATQDEFSPGVQVGYDYIASDDIGFTYGPGTGGPSPHTARANGRPFPVVYALPRVVIALNASGVSNPNFVRPGRKLRPMRRKQSRRTQ